MKSPHNKILGAVAILVSAAGCDDGGRGKPFQAPDFVIKRASVPEVIEHEDGTVTRQFPLREKSLMELAAFSHQAPDPFARTVIPEPPDDIRDLPLRVLKRYGVGFPEGTSVDYDPEAETLTVRQTPHWIDRIESLLDTVAKQEMGLNFRLEIYEVPAVLALRLEQSACDHPEHLAEWEALQKIVEAGDAEFVTSCNVRTRSGQIATVSAIEEYTIFTGFEKSKDDESAEFLPAFDVREVGTIAEVDAVLGPDDETIDVNLSLEHHTAPPTLARVEVPMPGGRDRAMVEMPSFHVKSIVTQITIVNGDTRLLCSWRPTGKPEFETKDVMRIVFLRADAQRIGGGG